jgi:hypothetical protein
MLALGRERTQRWSMGLYEASAESGNRQLSTTRRYTHHLAQRMVETVTAVARVWDLLPGPDAAED